MARNYFGQYDFKGTDYLRARYIGKSYRDMPKKPVDYVSIAVLGVTVIGVVLTIVVILV
ncbi:MAG: hypothetical protein WC390_09135 [Sulfurimonas sp.]|jgi:hypothetical protein